MLTLMRTAGNHPVIPRTTSFTGAVAASPAWKAEPIRAPDLPAASSSSAAGVHSPSGKTDPDARSRVRQAPGPSSPPPCKRVLIVEDDDTNARALRSIFTRKGCDVLAVNTLKDALARLDGDADYIVLDLMLPDGDGAEILRRVRAIEADRAATREGGAEGGSNGNGGGNGAAPAGPNVPRVVVMTGVSDAQRLREVQALRPHRLLRKPFDLVDLLGAIGMM